MNRVAFACPLYDMKNHFELAFNLYKSKIDNNICNDFYFVFSNCEQKNKFKKIIDESFIQKEFKYLITPDNINQFKAKAVSKKLFALETLMNKYDFIILVDCESLFIKNCDFSKIAEEIWKNKTMLNSNKSPDGFFIMRKCFKTMNLYNNKILRKDTCFFSYNFWFNDLQVYKCDTLPDFFVWLENHNKMKVYDEYMCFEYYVYYAYLLLEKGIHIKRFNYESMGGINEYLYRFPIEKQKEVIKKMDLHWVSSKEAINDKTVMLFHLDRSTNNNYSQDLTFNVKLRNLCLRIKAAIEDIIYND